MYLFTISRHGVSAKELQQQLGVTYKCAWRIGLGIRKYMGMIDGDEDLSGHVEADETYIGGRAKGARVHVSKKHMEKHLREFEFRYNMRQKPELMFSRLLASFSTAYPLSFCRAAD